MVSELIVRNNRDNIDVALLRGGRLVELHKITPENSFSIGDIYLGQIKKTSPALNAAFVNVGYEKDGFLHYHDLGPQYNTFSYFVKQTMSAKTSKWSLANIKNFPKLDKDGAIENVLKKKENILVQISKEPISTKGPRIVSEISLAGRYVVLLPFSNRISISQKIKSQAEKDRLKKLIKSIIPKNFGMIVITVAEGKKVAELDSDLRALINQWKIVHNRRAEEVKKDKFWGGLVRDFEGLRVRKWRKYVYEGSGTGPEASGGPRRSQIGGLGLEEGVWGLFQAFPILPCSPFKGLDLHLYGP